MLTKRTCMKVDGRKRRIRRAAIYLRETGFEDKCGDRGCLSINQQRLLCRLVATVIGAEVVGEFVELGLYWSTKPALRRLMERAGQDPQLDYLIVPSWAQLAADRDEAAEVAWRLGFAGTVVIPADEKGDFPWTWMAPSS